MNLNYKIENEGQTIVLIHGLSDNLEYWQPLTNRLKKKYRILRYDLRGHGKSESGNEKISMDTYTEDLLKLLDKLKIKKANLIGFSLGGAIALDFTTRHPERVSSLVLMSSFYKSDEYLTKIFTSLKKALKKGFPEFFDSILPMILCPETITEYEEELKMIKNSKEKTANTTAYIQAIDACINYNIEDKIENINVPTLILAGKYDEITLQSTQKALHNQIKNSKIVILDNVKHNLLVGENIDQISNIIENFIQIDIEHKKS